MSTHQETNADRLSHMEARVMELLEKHANLRRVHAADKASGEAAYDRAVDAESELAETKRRALNDILAKSEEIQSLRRELDATRRAKAENDERFQIDAAEARQEAEHLRRELENIRSEISKEE